MCRFSRCRGCLPWRASNRLANQCVRTLIEIKGGAMRAIGTVRSSFALALDVPAFFPSCSLIFHCLIYARCRRTRLAQLIAISVAFLVPRCSFLGNSCREITAFPAAKRKFKNASLLMSQYSRHSIVSRDNGVKNYTKRLPYYLAAKERRCLNQIDDKYRT